MSLFPYAAPALSSLAWAGDAASTVLMLTGSIVSTTLLILVLRARRKRVEHMTPVIELALARGFPRAAA